MRNKKGTFPIIFKQVAKEVVHGILQNGCVGNDHVLDV